MSLIVVSYTFIYSCLCTLCICTFITSCLQLSAVTASKRQKTSVADDSDNESNGSSNASNGDDATSDQEEEEFTTEEVLAINEYNITLLWLSNCCG